MTWHDLTFTASHVLTASDMNRMQENFSAMAQGASGAPALAVNSFTVSGVASIDTLHVSGEATLAGGGLPTGAVIPYAGATAPSGWLLCFGQAVSRGDYAALFALIGEDYGAGDGSTTFNVPDLRGRTAVGLDNLGGSGSGRITGAWADSLGGADGAETHAHTLSEDAWAQVTYAGGGTPIRMRRVSVSPAWTETAVGGGMGGGSSNNGTAVPLDGETDEATTLPPMIALSYIIKT